MDQLIPFLQGLIDQWGLFAVIAAFGAAIYFLNSRSIRRAEDARSAAESARKDADTARDNAFTAQFAKFSADNSRLQARVDTLEAAQVDLKAAYAAQGKELTEAKQAAAQAQAAQKASDERAEALTREVGTLRAKVMTLETERAVRTNELNSATERAAKLEREVADLRASFAKLEGENTALDKMLRKLNVVSVKPPPPDDDPPPTLHVEPKAA